MKSAYLFFSLLFVALSSYGQFKLYEKGHDSYTSGKYDDAITSFSQYLTKPTRDKAMDAEVFYLRALSYYKTSKFKNAIGDFEEALLLNHANKGNIYWFKAKCHAKLSEDADAIEEYSRAIKELSADKTAQPKLLLERGMLYKKNGDLLLAKSDFDLGLIISPDNSDLARENNDLNTKFLASRGAVPEQQKANDATKPKDNTAIKQNEPVKEEKVLDKNPVVKKEEKKPDNNGTLVKNDEKNVVPVQETTGEQKTLAQKTKALASKVGNKVGDTFKSNKTDEQKTDEQKPIQSETKTPVVTTAVETKPALSPLAEAYKDEKRYALVIGNSTYPKTIGVLKNPVNDATDLAKELRASNFDVQLLTNATYGQMRAAMLKFKEKIDAGDKDKTVSLFYFAGHGLQYEDENYLVPVDALIEFQDDISRYCFGVQKMVLANMERSNSRMNIVILDACRNNPFPAVTRSIGGQGLGEMRRARGSFIAYATAPGSVASDGSGRNGLYTQELLKAMKKPGLTIEQVFKEVRANVLKLSDDRQNTWDSSNIIGEFYFKF